MLTRYHEAITRQALSGYFSAPALQDVVHANLRQDELRGQFGHDEYHFDNNAFERSYAYLEEQRGLVRSALSAKRVFPAREAFGRLTHTAQDFYAHSNYVDLWLTRSGAEARPSTSEIEPLVEGLLSSPELRSGKLYYPLELLSFVPFLKPYVLPLLPRDSHAWMNLDAPERGYRFSYAFEAARKRTQYEYDRTVAGLSKAQVGIFSDLNG